MSDNPYQAPQPATFSGVETAQLYAQLPWYRKSPYVSIFVLLGLCCSPAILAVCIIVLTGDVYYNQPDVTTGGLKKWGYANKVVAFLILAVQIIVIAANVLGVARQVAGP